MGRKKPFIKKGEGVKFYLVHRSQKDPLYLAEDLGEHVLMPADPEQAMQSGLASTLNAHHGGPAARKKVGHEEQEKWLNEQMKYGIYYEDDYDYLQHLKEVNLNDDGEEAQEEVMKVGSVLIKTDAFGEEKKQTDKSNKLVLPSTVFASKFEEDIGYFNQAAPDHDPKIHWDPDIVRLLDEDAEINPEDDGELEDDFFVKANLEKGKKSQQRDDDDDDEEDGDEEDDNFSNQADDDDEDDYYDDEEGSETKSMRDMERRSRFSEYSMTSSIVPRNEGLKLLDEQFERFYAQYDEDQIGALDTEDIEGFRGQDLVLNAALEEFNKMMEKKGLVTERVPKVSKKKQLPVLKEKNEDEEEEEEEEESDEQDENNNDKDDEEEDSCDSDSDDTEKVGEDGEVLRYSRKRDRDDRLDCESIISTYSNIYNHPSMIGSEESKIKLSKKTGLPLGVLQEKEKSKREIERIEHNIVRVLPDLPLNRDKNESKDDKKERKQAIKAHRRERRVEKKINKTAFKEEKKSQIAQITSTNNNKNVVKLPL